MFVGEPGSADDHPRADAGADNCSGEHPEWKTTAGNEIVCRPANARHPEERDRSRQHNVKNQADDDGGLGRHLDELNLHQPRKPSKKMRMMTLNDSDMMRHTGMAKFFKPFAWVILHAGQPVSSH